MKLVQEENGTRKRHRGLLSPKAQDHKFSAHPFLGEPFQQTPTYKDVGNCDKTQFGVVVKAFG